MKALLLLFILHCHSDNNKHSDAAQEAKDILDSNYKPEAFEWVTDSTSMIPAEKKLPQLD